MKRTQETATERALRMRFRALVAERGGQGRVSAVLGYDQSVLSRYLNGKIGLSLSMARAITCHYPEMGREITAFFWGFDMNETQAVAASEVA